MLYSVILGSNTDDISNYWSLIENDDKSFIGNDSIRQRIKLGNSVDHTLNIKSDNGNVKSYDLPKNIFFSNNNKNMNLLIRHFFSKDKKANNNHTDDSVAYITLSNSDYKLLSYTKAINSEIVQTYHIYNSYIGLAIIFNANDTDLNILSINAYDKNRKVLVNISIKIDVNKDVVISTTDIVDNDETAKYNSLKEKYKKTNIAFKLDAKTKFLTQAYIVLKKDAKKLEGIISKYVKNYYLITVDTDNNGFVTIDDNTDNKIKNLFAKNYTKAVTLYNCKVGKTFCKDYKVYYLFVYDEKNKKLKCIHSN